MVKQTGIHAEGVNQLLRTMSRMGKEISEYTRDASTDLAEDFLRRVRSGTSTVPESRAAAVLKVYRDRVPKVGFPAGTRVAVSGNPKIGEFFYGTEFGGRNRKTTMQFRATNTFGGWGGTGYFFYPVLNEHGQDLAQKWFEVIFDALDDDWDAGARKAAASG